MDTTWNDAYQSESCSRSHSPEATGRDYNPRIWTHRDIDDDVPFAILAREWAKEGRSSEAIWGVLNFLTGKGHMIEQVLFDLLKSQNTPRKVPSSCMCTPALRSIKKKKNYGNSTRKPRSKR